MLKKITSVLLFGSFFAILAATATFWQTQNVKAVADSERAFGIVSLNAGQTLRFNVVNIGNDRRERRMRLTFDVYGLGGPDTCPQNAVAACTNNLRLLRRESCSASLRPLESVLCDFTAGEAAFVSARLIRDDETGPEPHLIPTLEMREGIRTIFVHPGAARGFNPQPDPPADVNN